MEGDVEYLSAEAEDFMKIAQANSLVGEGGAFLDERVKAREHGDFPILTPDELEYIDVAPNQIVGVSASLIPFLENDDANRALMGSNMQRHTPRILDGTEKLCAQLDIARSRRPK